ncbi:hypothetical protein BD309DRAFT_287219 [Dichomitus squalens]|nr:hypothetical protein BD309DRAFT_287219 [Dichomitus squalens]
MALPEEFEPAPNLSHQPTLRRDNPIPRSPSENQSLTRGGECSRRGLPSSLSSQPRPTYGRRSGLSALAPSRSPVRGRREECARRVRRGSEQKQAGRGESDVRDANSDRRRRFWIRIRAPFYGEFPHPYRNPSPSRCAQTGDLTARCKQSADSSRAVTRWRNPFACPRSRARLSGCISRCWWPWMSSLLRRLAQCS